MRFNSGFAKISHNGNELKTQNSNFQAYIFRFLPNTAVGMVHFD